MEDQKRLGHLVKAIDITVKSKVDDSLKSFDITKTQAEILVYLDRHSVQNLSQKDIETYFSISNPTVTGILNRLEAKGFIYRESSIKDARVKWIRQTSKAIEMHQTIKKKLDDNDEAMLSCLTADERETLLALLDKVCNHMK